MQYKTIGNFIKATERISRISIDAVPAYQIYSAVFYEFYRSTTIFEVKSSKRIRFLSNGWKNILKA